MRRRKLLAFLLAVASLAGAMLFRRRGARRRERIDLYYADGSVVTVPEGAPESATLTALGREFLRTARS